MRKTFVRQLINKQYRLSRYKGSKRLTNAN